MCRKQVEQQGGETSEYHASIIHCLSAEVDRSWQSFTTALIMPLQPVRPSRHRYSPSLLALFLFLVAFAKLNDGMKTGNTLFVLHRMTSELNVHNVLFCFAFLIDELRDPVVVHRKWIISIVLFINFVNYFLFFLNMNMSFRYGLKGFFFFH